MHRFCRRQPQPPAYACALAPSAARYRPVVRLQHEELVVQHGRQIAVAGNELQPVADFQVLRGRTKFEAAVLGRSRSTPSRPITSGSVNSMFIVLRPASMIARSAAAG